MVLPYNVTDIISAHSAEAFFTGINALTGGLYALLLMFALFMVLQAMFSRERFKVSMAASTFIISGLGALLWALKWIGFKTLIVPLVAMFGTITYLIIDRD